jgi:polyhydroxybutyrate depolymerase
MNPASELHGTIDMDGVRRSYEAHVPAGDGTPRPLLLVFHGGSGSAPEMRALTRLDARADEHAFVVAFLNSDGRWNDGREYDRSSKSDDVAFARATIADVSSQVAIDPSAVFAAGYANGAIFANRLGAELEGLAGMAAVCGYLAVGVKRPTRPLPVLMIAAVDDPLMPFAGGPLVMSSMGTPTPPRGSVLSAAENARMWARANGCSETGEVTNVPPRDPADPTRLRATVYRDPRGAARVTSYEVSGLGHVWPGGKAKTAHVGAGTKQIDASDAIAAFMADVRGC